MKKLLSILLVAAMAVTLSLSLVGCGGTTTKAKDTGAAPTTK